MTDSLSPNGGPTGERQRLSDRFSPRLSVNDSLNRRLVSYQGNRDVPGFRWLKYKEGFPGSFRKAGFRPVGHTKGGLVALQLLPGEFPPAERPIDRQGILL